MIGQLRVAVAESKTFAATKNFTMQGLWRLAVWGATAATALLIAVLTTRGEFGARRIAVAQSTLRPIPVPTQVVIPKSDEQAETRRLSEAVRGLAADDDQIKSRLAAVEHGMDDITGSVTQQIQQVKAAESAPVPWPDIGPLVPPTPAAIAAALSPMVPEPAVYGIDIGSAQSIPALRARWAGVRSAHPQLLDGLTPAVVLKGIPRSNRVELRLVVGPFASVDAAAQLCALLAPYRLTCQPTTFTGQHLALE